MEDQYAIVWFEGENVYTLVNNKDRPILLSKEHLSSEPSIHGVIDREDQVETANDDHRYAIRTHLLEELYGYVI